MKLEHWEPDIDAILRRIAQGEIDLQPNFQRGLVWNQSKQQRLIDTVLRDWSIPPVHLVVTQDEKMLVLDGQQRLSAIRNFTAGKFTVGYFLPDDPAIASYAGLHYEDLPAIVQRRFRNFRVSCYRLTDYQTEEPYELFFRLNMPTGLTQAEKRNSLIGETRMQIRALVDRAGWSAPRVGFANGRMSYDDIIARCCCYVEDQTLRSSISVHSLESRYRAEDGFSEHVVHTVGRAVDQLGEAIDGARDPIRFNKATLLSWVMVFARQQLDPKFSNIAMETWVPRIEHARALVRTRREVEQEPELDYIADLLDIYTDRASLRVADVLSVVARDLAIWGIVGRLSGASLFDGMSGLLPRVSGERIDHGDLLRLLQSDPSAWGRLL
ncbi:DUF262 domain-containing protein [Alteromonas gracilis]